jgi:hypothetical protein
MTRRSSQRHGKWGRRRALPAVAAMVAALAVAVPASAEAPPANDHFAAAKVIEGSKGLVTGHNFGATKEPLEPNHAGNPGGHSVWYSWTAPADGQYGFVTLNSDFDTLLAVYEGASLDALTEVASSEDAGDGSRASMLSFRAAAGVVYRIAIDGFAGKVGKIGLQWMPAPANDNFADAQEIAGRSGSVSGTTVGATWEPGEPWDGESDGATVWYRWTAPTSGTFSFDTRGSRIDSVLSVYVGASVTDLERVAANDDDAFLGCCTSRVGFTAAAGQTYHLAVDVYYGWGALQLAWRPIILGTAGDANDRVASSGGNDRLVGGSGRDTLVDLNGRDALHGSGGDDRLNARDGARGDALAGGGGTDICLSDSRDARAGCP